MSAPVTILLKLNDGCWVNALDITSVKTNYDSRITTIRMRDGIGHYCTPNYGESVFDAETRIVSHINQAAAAYAGLIPHEPKFKPSSGQS